MGRKSKIGVIIVVSLLFIPGSVKSGHAREYINFPGAFHVQSTVSDGRYSIDKLMAKALEKDVKIVVLTDSLLRRWEYGIWPFRNLIKRRVKENSVLEFGVQNYFKQVNEVQKDFPDLLILPGIEVSPFYFWQGDLFRKSLSLHNWHEQMLIVGLDKADYKKLPVVSNYSFLPQRLRDLCRFWPLGTIFLGIWLAHRQRKRRFLLRGQIFSSPSFPYKYIGYVIAAFGIICLINNLFFPVSKYDQYHGNQGIKPYQDLIDYVKRKGGLVFWAHPEVVYSQRFKGIDVHTPAYAQDLGTADNYTGFASLYQDNITVTSPGDRWDQILIQYCQGKRESPVWGVGEIDFQDFQGLFKQIDTVQTVFLLPKLDREAAMDALKRGRVYAKFNILENDFSLDRFVVSDSAGSEQGYMGDEVVCQSKPMIFINGSCSTCPEEEISIQLIRKGEVIKVFEVKGAGFDIRFEDDYFRQGEKIYYRLNITSNHSTIVSNPIFVRFSD